LTWCVIGVYYTDTTRMTHLRKYYGCTLYPKVRDIWYIC